MNNKYDFTTVVDRSKMGSSKWEGMKKINPNVEDGIIPLSVADMEFVTQPEIVNGLKKILDENVLGYTSPTDSYYDAVISWMKNRHQWHIEKEWFTIIPGIVPAIRALIKVFSEPGDGVVLLTPVYYPFYMAIEKNGNEIVTSSLIDTGGYYEVDFANLEEKLSNPKNTIMILCSPHNPIGRVWKKEELVKIADLCIKYNVLLINDEIHHDIVMPGYKHIVLASIDEKYQNSVITCTSVSKTFNLAGMCVSNIIIKNEEYRNKLQAFFDDLFIRRVNALSYAAVEIAYNECLPWLEEMISVIDDNKNYTIEFLKQHFPKAKVYPMEGTYLLWIDFREVFDDYKEMERFMTQDAQAFFDEGYIFGKEGEGFERISLTCPKSVLADCLQRIVDSYNKK